MAQPANMTRRAILERARAAKTDKAKQRADAAAAQAAQAGPDAAADPNPPADPVPPQPRKDAPREAPQGGKSNAKATDPGEARDAPRARKGGARSSKDEVDRLARALAHWHKLAGVAMQCPELFLTAEEAIALAQTLSDLQEEFGVELGGRAMLVVTAIGTLGGIYIPKFMLILARIEHMKRSAPAAHAPNGADSGPVIDPDGRPVS